MTANVLPQFLKGEVVKGFGRGSKQLGCPTANYSLDVVKSLPRELKPGVYYGWAQVDSGPVYKMVTNIGWCPFYGNKEMSVETHVIHKFDEDFYGQTLKIAIVGYLRGEKNFDSLDGLIDAIKQDIANGEEKLDQPDAQKIRHHSFFSQEKMSRFYAANQYRGLEEAVNAILTKCNDNKEAFNITMCLFSP